MVLRKSSSDLPKIMGASKRNDENQPMLAVGDPAARFAKDDVQPWGLTKVWHRLVEQAHFDHVGEPFASSLARSNPERVWQFLRDLPIGLVLYDEQFRIVYQNAASEEMTGYPSAEFAGENPIGLWIPEVQRGNVDEMLRRMREEKVALHGRGVHVRRDQQMRWVQWYTTPLFDGIDFIGYLGTHSELSEEVRAAKHQSELLIDAATDIAMVQLSLQGHVLSWNSNAATLFDTPAEKILGASVERLFAADGIDPELPNLLLGIAHAGGRAEYEGWIGRNLSTRFWGHFRLYPQRDEEGVVDALVMIARDLSERRRNEQQEHDSEALLSAIVSTANDAILGIDDDDHVILCNPAAEIIFGRSAAELGQGPLPSILPRGEVLRELVTHRRTLSGYREDGRVLHLEVSATQINAGGRRLLTLFARDVTERVESEQEVVQYREQLSVLTRELMHAEQKTNRRLAQLLHDQFGQTLTSLRIFVDAVRARLPENDDERVRNGWRQISSLIDRGMREVREVLVELRPALLQEQGLAVALDNEVRAQAAKRPEIRLTLHTGTGLATRRWSPDVEYAAFMIAREAIANALLHSSGGKVVVKLEANGANGLLLLVRDDGEGLSHDAPSEKPGHLGLVGMRERALGIGAEFSVTSVPRRRGTTIQLKYSP